MVKVSERVKGIAPPVEEYIEKTAHARLNDAIRPECLGTVHREPLSYPEAIGRGDRA